MKVLICLDLEGTLISNAVSQVPRPGLKRFLERLHKIADIAIYTSVGRNRLEKITQLLTLEGSLPPWFKDLPVIHPTDTIKKKAACKRPEAFLVDDQGDVIAEGEEDWWIPIKKFEPPYPDSDKELGRTLKIIQELVRETEAQAEA